MSADDLWGRQREVHEAIPDRRGSQGNKLGPVTEHVRDIDVQMPLEDGYVSLGLGAEVFFELEALVVVVQRFDALLEAESEKQTEADGSHVDQKVTPRKDGVLRVRDFSFHSASVRGFGEV